MRRSVFLDELAGLAQDGRVTLGEIAERLRGKGLVFLALVAVLPFLQPIPLPGISTLLGMVIALQGVALMTTNRPLLTRNLRDRELPLEKLDSFIRGAQRVFRWVGWMVAPRGASLVHHRAVHALAGAGMVFLSLVLALPLPIPASNFVPALGIFFLCLGLLEDDLLLIILGLGYTGVFGWMLALGSGLLWEGITQGGWGTLLGN